MRIDTNPTAQPLHQGGRTGSRGPAASNTSNTSPAARGALREDSAQFSGTRVQVQTLVAQALQFPEIRQEKVNPLRQSVLGGSYQSSSEQVAAAVLDHIQVASAA